MKCRIRRCNRRAVRNGLCNIHSQTSGGRASVLASNTFTGPSSTYGSLYTNKATADKITTFGRNTYAASYLLPKTTEKIWMPISKREHLEAIKRTSNHRYPAKVNRRKYDYVPEGPLSGYHKKRTLGYRNYRYVSDQEAHWERRPRKGQYSRQNEWTNVRKGSKMRVMGAGAYLTGTGIKYLGYAGIAYSAYQVAKEPGEALDILLSFNPTYMLNPRSVRETQTTVTKSVTESYLSRYARALRPQ